MQQTQFLHHTKCTPEKHTLHQGFPTFFTSAPLKNFAPTSHPLQFIIKN